MPQLAGPDVDDPLPVVVITTFVTDHVTGALRAGAKCFLLTDAGSDRLIQAIRVAAEGDASIAPQRHRPPARPPRRLQACHPPDNRSSP
jgi:DNA-binding NarL/FixJ family response regulator